MNAASVSKIINQRSNIEASSETHVTTRNNHSHVHIATQKELQKVHTQMKPGQELRQGIWGPNIATN